MQTALLIGGRYAFCIPTHRGMSKPRDCTHPLPICIVPEISTPKYFDDMYTNRKTSPNDRLSKMFDRVPQSQKFSRAKIHRNPKVCTRVDWSSTSKARTKRYTKTRAGRFNTHGCFSSSYLHLPNNLLYSNNPNPSYLSIDPAGVLWITNTNASMARSAKP